MECFSENRIMLSSFRSNLPEKMDQPSWLARIIAGFSISVRLKLLAVFVGLTFLMIGLAILGLQSLQQANARTEKLLKDQERIALFNVLYGYAGDLATSAAAIGLEPENVPKNSGFAYEEPGFTLNDRTGELLLEAAHVRRKIGREGMPDAKLISDIRANIKQLISIAGKAKKLRQEGYYSDAGIVALSEFVPIINRLQRTTYSRVQEIEAEMAATAKSTALAYKRSRQLVIASAVGAVGLALLLGYAVSASLIWPVQRIGKTLGVVAGGDFDARVSVPNRDELGELAENVNATSERLGNQYKEIEVQREELAAEHEKSEALLYNLLPKQIAARLKIEPDQTIADSLPLVAILFADVVDFTPRASSLTPEEVVGFLNRIFSRFDVLAEHHKLEKIKTIGDAYMVAAGMPVPVEKPMHKIAAMALDMLRATEEMSSEFPGGLQVRIGLHSGPAVAGVIGNNKLFYDVWGETVNTASRMESFGEPGRIQVTNSAYEELRQTYSFEERGVVDVKGLGAINTWWLLAKRTS